VALLIWSDAAGGRCHVTEAVAYVAMEKKSLYHGHRFPAAVVSCAVRWYFRFQLSLRDIEELLFERGVVVSYETIRRWCEKFGEGFAHRVKAARRKPGSTWHLDEMFVKLRGEPYLLWRAVDEHGAELEILLQKRRDKAAAKNASSNAWFAHAPCRARS
jgi:putative transposase